MPAEDLRDDQLLGHDEAAALILGLQDRTTRDRAAEWMEGGEAGPALRLWRALARRCAGPYGEHAAAPLTLAGWVAWSTGDELEAREALAMALGADPDYLFARLLHQACNEGLDPESVRRCLRAERGGSGGAEGGTPDHGEQAGGRGDREQAGPSSDPQPPSGRRRRTRSVASADGVRRRARTQGRAPGTKILRPRTPTGAERPGAAGTGRTRSRAPEAEATGRKGTGPEGTRAAERGRGGGDERI